MSGRREAIHLPLRHAFEGLGLTCEGRFRRAVVHGRNRDADWFGYFADQDGYRWEVAWHPHPIGQLVLPEVES